MSKLHSVVAMHDADGICVLDVRTLPEEVKCEIMMAAFVVATHYGNGDIDIPNGEEAVAAFNALQKATDRIDAHMHRLPAPQKGLQ